MSDRPDQPDQPDIPDTQFLERKLATILSADVAEFSRLMGEDEEQTLRVFREHKKVFESLVAMHRGRVFNTAGDAILAEFGSAVEAVRCATDIQAALRTRNDQLPPSRQVRFRIGINLGDVMIQGQDLLGDRVNVAARLQTAAEPGGICISGSVHDQIRNKLSLSFQSLGEKSYKNIQQPVRTFSILEGEGGNTLPYSRQRSAWRSPAIWMSAAVLLVAGGGYAAYLVHQHSKTTNLPMTASAVRPQSAPSQPLVSGPAMTVEKPATSQPRPKAGTPPPTKQAVEITAPSAKAALPPEGLKPTTKSQDASVPAASSGPVQARRSASAHAPSARRGAFDGLYAGPV